MMSNDRPRIKVPLESFDVVLELISITLIILMWVYLIVEYQELPETIASHFNAKGEADGYSSKNYLWFLPIISTVMYVSLFMINKFPHTHNYMVNITEENALKNYRFSTRIVRVVNTLTVIMFAYIIYYIVQNAKEHDMQFSSWFVPSVISFSILLPIGIYLYYKKINKS
ncbi:DUF1648 domain-containing protein [Hanstruepera ponticola]|uniref:DUF1648 domain-containing protein n=1 Tax=Hanstruepera ponticola TaxID=2042995 RepID=UPI000CF0E56E|nr:DUF1648 domain-containing protein [Hanstruepera ponticola]